MHRSVASVTRVGSCGSGPEPEPPLRATQSQPVPEALPPIASQGLSLGGAAGRRGLCSIDTVVFGISSAKWPWNGMAAHTLAAFS
jgi:hypothetical protein